MTADELDGHLVELQTKGLNLRGTLRKLLLKHAAKNDTKFVLSLMKVRQARVYFPTISPCSMTWSLFSL